MTGLVLFTGIVGYTGTTAVVLPPLLRCSESGERETERQVAL